MIPKAKSIAGLAGAALTALCTNQAPKIRAAEIEETQEEPTQETMKETV